MTSKRQLIAAAAVLALAACTQRATTTGRPPENLTREQELLGKQKKPDRQAAYDEREERAKARDAGVERVDPADARIGVAGTHVFHRADCPRLKDVPGADRIQFTSKYDGVDANFTPCAECRAMN